MSWINGDQTACPAGMGCQASEPVVKIVWPNIHDFKQVRLAGRAQQDPESAVDPNGMQIVMSL